MDKAVRWNCLFSFVSLRLIWVLIPVIKWVKLYSIYLLLYVLFFITLSKADNWISFFFSSLKEKRKKGLIKYYCITNQVLLLLFDIKVLLYCIIVSWLEQPSSTLDMHQSSMLLLRLTKYPSVVSSFLSRNRKTFSHHWNWPTGPPDYINTTCSLRSFSVHFVFRLMPGERYSGDSGHVCVVLVLRTSSAN